MDIRAIHKTNCLDLIPIFIELEHYYFKEKASSKHDLVHYLKSQVFSEHSGVNIIAVYDNDDVVGFASYTVMFPAPKLSGQMYLKDLFVSSKVRGKGVGLKLMKYLASLAIKCRCQRLDWTAESSNPTAGQFYRSIGATLIHEKEYYRFSGDALREFAKTD
ncbi:GNAT family N-acetyltransferase [Vibrio alginolyticus]|nr:MULTISPECIES: GNAT family N-acetyltransferase [Vibrio]MDG2788287.1 GNAT family N-acetyltransferase [Vibrio parahaemolyticus]EGQ7904135.1 GNAT family N-acetyltransferase [Vibrio alginolyticus]EGQ9112003.1 GNAT family N-acetyltransferase [Vibrio alginolyticus]EGQ9763109.1 GNAT family N-acetyltransferase [Vibrio alginolyticus]EGR1562683.1 GNAT family N-acetyltransferase [Vibrio alginolyticus]